ncbi:uncharacterized protein isoform X2 [Bombus fervidus]|uniref:uncharacterized protein isoform X2 n=1 Tax=Bombus fervidus TaxID=203811 RepID=UPI003AB4FC42
MECVSMRCIDFSDYKNLSKFELIELYKRVALPLPQRQSESTQNSDIRQHNETMYSVNESHRNPVSLNGTSTRKTDVNETAKEILCTRPKSSANELKQTSNKICLYNSNTFTKCNSIGKRNNDGKHDEAPSKKRQKITWP